MNFLAHSFLSCSDADIRLGNIIADMIKNKEVEGLDKGIIHGIELHRKIDSFTDGHPAIKRCTKLLHERQGKYATVIVDIFFDHILFLNWDQYSATSFPDFKKLVYKDIDANTKPLPTYAADRLQRMLSGDWLEGYTTSKGMNYVFGRVAERAKFENNLADAMTDFYDHQDALQRDFDLFFPEIIEMVNDQCQNF